MPTPIDIPECARKLLEFLYPTVNWNGVMFFSGTPAWTKYPITIPNPLGVCGFRIYLGDYTALCKNGALRDDLMRTIVHEGFHVQQFTGIAAGCGIGFVRPGFLKYFACYFVEFFLKLGAYSLGPLGPPGSPKKLIDVYEQAYSANPFEVEAYKHARAFHECHKTKVCDCATGEPVFNPAALDALKACDKNLIVVRPRIPKCGTWWSWLLAVVVGTILGILAFLFHLLDLLNCQYLQMQSQQCANWGASVRQECAEWADQGNEQCTDWADESYQQCTQWTDQGYSTCSQWADWGENVCCDWWPCSWACDAVVWVSNLVCTATVWISNLVCQATIWVLNMVCHAWIWIANMACIAWTLVVEMVCLLWTTVLRTILLCWWK